MQRTEGENLTTVTHLIYSKSGKCAQIIRTLYNHDMQLAKHNKNWIYTVLEDQLDQIVPPARLYDTLVVGTFFSNAPNQLNRPLSKNYNISSSEFVMAEVRGSN